MTTSSSFQSTGLSIIASDPLVRGTSGSERELTAMISNYNHVEAADGGYVSASIVLTDQFTALEEWLQSGIGRHIVVSNAGGVTAWEGFVNKILVNAGSLQASRGPLTNVANRVSVMYTPIIDPNTSPPVTGVQTETIIVEDSTSQAKYGVWEKIVNGGTCLDDEAEYIRDTFLAENSEPETSNVLSFGGGGSENINVSLECRGYDDWLEGYVYNDETAPISTTVTDKIEAVLAADPNSIISTDYSQIDDNASLVPSWEDQNRTAGTVIKSAVVLGDVNGNRWLFGIYANRRVYFKVIPTTVDYYHYIMSQAQRVETPFGTRVDAWDVLPGRFVLMPDFLIGRANETELRRDQRVLFIEQMTFTAPNQIQLQGNKVVTLPQIMARMGMGGIG